jgi:SPASM domain peptide maturase of grasp-with-spasm system
MNENNDIWYILSSNCKIVSGYNRALIIDLKNNKYDIIPTSLANLINEDLPSSFNSIRDKYKLHKETIDEYFDFLTKEGYVIKSNSSEYIYFNASDSSFVYPHKVSNIIIDYSTKIDFYKIVEFINNNNAVSLQLRFFDVVHLDIIKEVVCFFDFSVLKSIEIIAQNVHYDSINDVEKFILSNDRLFDIYILGNIEEKIIECGHNFIKKIYLLQGNISVNKCGIIHPNYFIANRVLFLESQHYNTCLNRKISIDVNGNIKNCPSMQEHFGNILTTDIEEVFNNINFRKLWEIKKDNIETCKDCEFRHVCSDCRAYIDEPENIYSKPLKCGYSPYTNEWEDWSKNDLKEKTIKYYNLND